MAKEEPQHLESLESWIAKRPRWEQFVWKINFETAKPTEEQMDECFRRLLVHAGAMPRTKEDDQPLTFFSGPDEVSETSSAAVPPPIRLTEIRSFENVNALPLDSSVPLSDRLTLIFGINGTGKSGICRLLANACASRAKHEVLPNARVDDAVGPAAATITYADADGTPHEVRYSLGDRVPELKRFSVFDSQSIKIHIDQANSVQFTPAHLAVFDRVPKTIQELETRVQTRQREIYRENPFEGLFVDGPTSSPTARFCSSIGAHTSREHLERLFQVRRPVLERRLGEIGRTMEQKRKLDVPRQVALLEQESDGLEALAEALEEVRSVLSPRKRSDANKLAKQIQKNREVLKHLSLDSLDSGLLLTIGTDEWRALLEAARVLFDLECEARESEDLEHCPLCQQPLKEEQQALFNQYWEFLEDRAAKERDALGEQREEIQEALRSAQETFPKLRKTDPGVAVLQAEEPDLLSECRDRLTALRDLLKDWQVRVGSNKLIPATKIPTLRVSRIRALASKKSRAAASLVDPTPEIRQLEEEALHLRHQLAVLPLKQRALEYHDHLVWASQANKLNLAGTKSAITKKRTELFLAGVAQDYKNVFNVELAALDCNFDLEIWTSGELGNTVKEYRFTFSDDYSLSQILSDGEQNACALADFLAEAKTNPLNCGLILDDPVTSLDHGRRDLLAKRLVAEAKDRQVVIFTHDLLFAGQLVRHAADLGVELRPHWIQSTVNGPGYIDHNTRPKLATRASHKDDAQDAIKKARASTAKDAERNTAVALDHLRAACEATVEELVFAKTIERYEDPIKVQNLEEVITDQALLSRIVDLHGEISNQILAHNRSDTMQSSPLSTSTFEGLWNQFVALERDLVGARKAAREAREVRQKARKSNG